MKSDKYLKIGNFGWSVEESFSSIKGNIEKFIGPALGISSGAQVQAGDGLKYSIFADTKRAKNLMGNSVST